MYTWWSLTCKPAGVVTNPGEPIPAQNSMRIPTGILSNTGTEKRRPYNLSGAASRAAEDKIREPVSIECENRRASHNQTPRSTCFGIQNDHKELDPSLIRLELPNLRPRISPKTAEPSNFPVRLHPEKKNSKAKRRIQRSRQPSACASSNIFS